jgi:hypothetical protein
LINKLFQLAVWLTVPVNISGAVIFSSPMLREFIGLPAPTHTFYGVLVGSWIGLFALGFLYAAMTKTYDKTFIAVSAFGKLSFFALTIFYFLQRDAGILVLLASLTDAALATIFLAWLWHDRKA